MKLLSLIVAIMAIIFVGVSGMRIVPDAGIKENRDAAGCNGGRPPPPPPPTNSTS